VDANAATLPTFLVVTATDPVAGTGPTTVAQSLGDVLKISKAQYAKDTRTLVISATPATRQWRRRSLPWVWEC